MGMCGGVCTWLQYYFDVYMKFSLNGFVGLVFESLMWALSASRASIM